MQIADDQLYINAVSISRCMDRIGNYRTRPFSRYRKNVILVASEGWRRRTIKFLVEADVTDAREKIRRKKEEGKDISFTAWIIKCLSQAL